MIDSGDTAWKLTSTALVLLMTLPGLARFYAGLVQSKNTLSVLMQCITIAALSSVVWMLDVYVPVTHWVWDGGWLAEMGVMDYAGGIGVNVDGGAASQFLVQAVGVAATFVIVAVIAATISLRDSKDEEIEGLDFSAHGEKAYNQQKEPSFPGRELP